RRDRNPLEQRRFPRPVLPNEEGHRLVHPQDGQRADHWDGVREPVASGFRYSAQLDRAEVLRHQRILSQSEDRWPGGPVTGGRGDACSSCPPIHLASRPAPSGNIDGCLPPPPETPVRPPPCPPATRHWR